MMLTQNSKSKLTKYALGLVGGLLLSPAIADEISVSPVTDSIHVIHGNGGNVGVFIGSDGTFMIDDKFAPMSETIMEMVRSLGGDHPKYMLNTHFHADHTGGNEPFGAAGSTIVAHHNVHKRLAEGSFITAFGMDTPPAPDVALPEITFDSDIVFHINGERVRVFHVPPAHTDGDAVIHFEGSNVIHAGDIFFNGFYPFIDVEHGGNVPGMINAVNQILDMADAETKIIPGHGPLANKDDLIAYRDMLVIAEQKLSALKAEGKTAEQAIAENPLAELDDPWGKALFDTAKWISIIYDGVGS